MEQVQINAPELNIARSNKMAQVGEKFFNFQQISSHFGHNWVRIEPRKIAIIYGHMCAIFTVYGHIKAIPAMLIIDISNLHMLQHEVRVHITYFPMRAKKENEVGNLKIQQIGLQTYFYISLFQILDKIVLLKTVLNLNLYKDLDLC